MSRLAAILTKVTNYLTMGVDLGAAVADDGTGDPIEVGAPSPLRADPATGALKTIAVEGASSTVPLVGDLAITDAAPLELSDASPDGEETSLVRWTLIVPAGGAAVRVGGPTVTTSTGITVAAGTQYPLPTSTLTGWWAIPETGSVTVQVQGAGVP